MMPAWTPRRFAARFPRRLLARARLALPIVRDRTASALWMAPGCAVPLYLVARALGIASAPVDASQLFSGAAFLAAVGVWGAVFALPQMEHRGQMPDPRLALFLTVHPLVAWMLAALPGGYGAAVYFSLVIAVGCGGAVYQTAVARQHRSGSPFPTVDAPCPTKATTDPIQHRVDAAHGLTGPHWLRRSAQESPAPVPLPDEPRTPVTDFSGERHEAADRAVDVLRLETARAESAGTSPTRPAHAAASDVPGYLLERRVAGPLETKSRSATNGLPVEPGEGSISGRVTIAFAAQQKQQVAHIPFWPPFARLPMFDCEIEGDADLRIQPFVHTYGARLELKRSGDTSRALVVMIAFHGELNPASQRAAA